METKGSLIEVPHTQEMMDRSSEALAAARAATIATREDYDRYGEYGKNLANVEKMIEAAFDGTEESPGPCALAHRTWKKLTDLRREALAPVVEAKRLLSVKLGTWWRTEEDRLDAERRKQEEMARKAEADRLRAEGASKREIEAVKSGKVDVPMPPPAAPIRTAGVAPKETWSAEVSDKMALVKAVAAGKVPLAALEPNMTYLNGQVRLLKKEFQVPGVKAVATAGTAFSRR